MMSWFWLGLTCAVDKKMHDVVKINMGGTGVFRCISNNLVVTALAKGTDPYCYM